MNKYKVCPYCGEHNLPKMLECIKCETDLSNVRVVDEEIENRKHANQEKTRPARMVRICDCGYKNSVNTRKCVNCGEDISDVVPREEEEETQIINTQYTLTSVDGDYVFKISERITDIGRESGMSDYLRNKLYVSRKHAELIQEGSKLHIRNISQTNYTYVNNVKIVQEMCELHEGDELGLGGNNMNGERQQDAAYFKVGIISCT